MTHGFMREYFMFQICVSILPDAQKNSNQKKLCGDYLFLFNCLEYIFNTNNSCERSHNTFGRECLVF